MYRNGNGNNGGRSVQNPRGSAQNGRARPNAGNQVRVNNHNGNPNQNRKNGGTGTGKPNGGRNFNSRRPS